MIIRLKVFKVGLMKLKQTVRAALNAGMGLHGVGRFLNASRFNGKFESQPADVSNSEKQKYGFKKAQRCLATGKRYMSQKSQTSRKIPVLYAIKNDARLVSIRMSRDR